MRRPAALLVLMLPLAALGDTPMQPVTLPRLQLPPNTLIYYENMAPFDADRSANRRYRLAPDGCFYRVWNQRPLFVTDPKKHTSDDPKLHWNTSLPAEPQRCLTAEQIQTLRSGLKELDLSKVVVDDLSVSLRRESHPSVERWTIVQDSGTQTLVVDPSERPDAVSRLDALVKRLVAASPRVSK